MTKCASHAVCSRKNSNNTARPIEMWHAAQIIPNESVVWMLFLLSLFFFAFALALIIRCVNSIIIEFWYDSSTKLDQHDLIWYSLKSVDHTRTEPHFSNLLIHSFNIRILLFLFENRSFFFGSINSGQLFIFFFCFLKCERVPRKNVVQQTHSNH